MIPNFKTYLIESVWGDLRKKSLGQEIREEDNIDDLDRGICRHIDDRAVGIRLLVCPDVPGTVGSLRLHLQHAERGAALEGDRVH